MFKVKAKSTNGNYWLNTFSQATSKISMKTLSVKTLTEATAGGALSKKLYLKISQNSQENTSVRVSFLIKLQASANRFSLFA